MPSIAEQSMPKMGAAYQADGPGDPVRQPEVAQVVSELEDRAESLEHLLGVLRDRLEPVLLPAELQEARGASGRAFPESPLARRIASRVEHSEMMCDLIEDLLRRLEV